MRELQLTQGKVALVDDADWPAVSERKWRAVFINEDWYAATSVGRKTVYLHRFVTHAVDGTEVDHRDHDGLNCVQSNLRQATRSQNAQNLQDAHRDSLTGVRGVTFDKHAGRYQALVIVNYRRIYLGSYPTLAAAEQAAIAGRRRYMTHSPECAPASATA